MALIPYQEGEVAIVSQSAPHAHQHRIGNLKLKHTTTGRLPRALEGAETSFIGENGGDSSRVAVIP
jgi:hypothetical protein